MKWRAYRAEICFHSEFSSCSEYLLIFAKEKIPIKAILACIIHEDSAPRVIIAKQVARSPEKRGLPRAERGSGEM